MKNIVAEENACPFTATKQFEGTGKTVLNAPRHEIIDADSIQMSAEIALGRVI